mmetsp:Transcript_48734/g.150484  ORF Transcript_48734/g.150484 Transcript_48734/m.150484 type:complete len:309 (+) Transcript_48734:435-1361(+)
MFRRRRSHSLWRRQRMWLRRVGAGRQNVVHRLRRRRRRGSDRRRRHRHSARTRWRWRRCRSGAVRVWRRSHLMVHHGVRRGRPPSRDMCVGVGHGSRVRDVRRCRVRGGRVSGVHRGWRSRVAWVRCHRHMLRKVLRRRRRQRVRVRVGHDDLMGGLGWMLWPALPTLPRHPHALARLWEQVAVFGADAVLRVLRVLKLDQCGAAGAVRGLRHGAATANEVHAAHRAVAGEVLLHVRLRDGVGEAAHVHAGHRKGAIERWVVVTRVCWLHKGAHQLTLVAVAGLEVYVLNAQPNSSRARQRQGRRKRR